MQYVSSYCHICVLILLHVSSFYCVCLHTTIRVLSVLILLYFFLSLLCVRILLHVSHSPSALADSCPPQLHHIAIYVSPYCYTCPHTATCISAACAGHAAAGFSILCPADAAAAGALPASTAAGPVCCCCCMSCCLCRPLSPSIHACWV
jgi:hypothetical protein